MEAIMLIIRRLLFVLVPLIFLHGCVSTEIDPTIEIVGVWSSSISGYSIETKYTDAMVAIDDHPPVPYRLEGDQLVIDDDEVLARRVSFPSRDEMLQIDLLTATEHRYTRKQP